MPDIHTSSPTNLSSSTSMMNCTTSSNDANTTTPTRNKIIAQSKNTVNASSRSIHPASRYYWHGQPDESYSPQVYSSYARHEYENISYTTSSYALPSSPPPLHHHSYYRNNYWNYHRTPTQENHQHIHHEFNSPSRVHSYLSPSFYYGTPIKRQQQYSSPRSVYESYGDRHTAYNPAKEGTSFHNPNVASRDDANKQSKTIPSWIQKTEYDMITKKDKTCSQTNKGVRKQKKVETQKKKQNDSKIHSVAKAAVKKEIQKLKRCSDMKVSKDEVGRLEEAFIMSQTKECSKNTIKASTKSSIPSGTCTSFEKKIQNVRNSKKRQLKKEIRKRRVEAEKQKHILKVQKQSHKVQKQKQLREERLKRRREIASLPAEELTERMRQPKRKRSKSRVEKRNDVGIQFEERELTEYEKLRLQKIKRNENRLKELGLLK